MQVEFNVFSNHKFRKILHGRSPHLLLDVEAQKDSARVSFVYQVTRGGRLCMSLAHVAKVLAVYDQAQSASTASEVQPIEKGAQRFRHGPYAGHLLEDVVAKVVAVHDQEHSASTTSKVQSFEQSHRK